MKVLHLSDIHIGYQDCTERFSVIIGNIIASLTPAWQFVIVVTGDIVDNGWRENQLDEAVMLLKRLEDAGFTVLMAPGNHDYGSGISPSDKVGRLFHEKFHDDPAPTYPLLGRSNRPGLIGNVAFIGLDSMEQEADDKNAMWGAQGRLGERQLERLDVLLGLGDVKNCFCRVLYLHHHPFDTNWTHALRDASSLQEVLARHGNVDVILFGHRHGGWKWHGAWGVLRCYDGGSATRKKDDPGYHRVLDLSKPPAFDYDGDFLGPRSLKKIEPTKNKQE
jgi:3',5'-cyclic AMP phosphodiesterase CpdA